jgi:hypothetical protein
VARIDADDADDSAALTDYGDRSRTKTSAKVDVALSAADFGSAYGPTFLCDAKEIVQELVNRTGFGTTSSMSFYIEPLTVTSGGSRTFRMADHATSFTWRLDIDYIDSESYTTSLLMGSRRVDRGASFRSHLNFMQDQPESFTLTLGENTQFIELADSFGITLPRKQAIEVVDNFAQETGAYIDRAKFRIHAPLSADFNGRFRAFARIMHDSIVTDPTYFRLRVESGAGGVAYTGAAQLSYRAEIEAVELGIVSIPEIGMFDYIEIALQATRTGGATFTATDMILIPIDEWAVELSSLAKSSLGMLDGDNYLEVDGITPASGAAFMRALVRNKKDNTIRAEFIHSGGRPVLDNRATQRVYCLALTDTGIGSGTDVFINASKSNAVLSVSTDVISRYLGFRGAR